MKKRFLPMIALGLLTVSASLCYAEADDTVVMMNIPYTDFYQAEMDLPEDYEVDAVSSATEKIYKNPEFTGGSYYVEEEDGTHSILGVSFPVLVEDSSILEGGVFTEVDGADTLRESASYSYYIPEEAPGYYKELSVEGDDVVFGEVQNLPSAEADGVVPVLDEVKGRRGDYKIDLEGFDYDTAEEEHTVYAVIVKTAEEAYPLRHLENIFEGNELAINAGSSKLIKGVNPAMPANYESIVGQTITEIVYYTSDGIYTFDADIELPDDLDNKGYVLMNIPYDKFYEAEVTDASNLDAVSSATMMKTRAGSLAGGTYHTDPEGSDISGVIYPVYVNDLAALPELGGEEITDESSVEITVTLRGEEATDIYEGQDALFEAPSYSWYVMQEGSLPKQYKTLTMGDEPSFSGINKEDKPLVDVGLDFTFVTNHHKDIEMEITGTEETLGDAQVKGIVFTTDDGTKVGLRHLENIWRGTEIGFDFDSAEYAALEGKTVTEIRLITDNANYAIPVNMPMDDISFGVFAPIAGKNGGTYANLFEVILADDCYDLWYDYVAAVIGEENAADTVAMLQSSISADIYGEEAIEAYADGGMAFDCWYINDVDTFTFKGHDITATMKDGTSETHTYEYLGHYSVGEGETMTYMGEEMEVAFPCDVYKSTDEAGEFNYFFLRDDTMQTTYHLEFRYGRDLEELQGYFVGPYACWLAAGIIDSADEDMIENVIALFCLENMDYSAHTDAALAQLAALGFVGKWEADFSEWGGEYEGVELYFTIDENGHGETFMDGEQTADFEAYAEDSGEKGDGAGIYVAYSNLEYEPEAAKYTLEKNEDGQQVLTFYAEDGIISYVKAE